jgi:hypothetical protein
VGASGPAPNRYVVDVRRDDQGWTVAIVAPDGREASVRACRDEAEARTYASTVRQHIGWLSEGRFREQYRLPEVR